MGCQPARIDSVLASTHSVHIDDRLGNTALTASTCLTTSLPDLDRVETHIETETGLRKHETINPGNDDAKPSLHGLPQPH